MIEAILLFYLIKGLNHETSQNVCQIIETPVFLNCISDSQEKCPGRTDEGRYSPLNHALLPPAQGLQITGNVIIRKETTCIRHR